MVNLIDLNLIFVPVVFILFLKLNSLLQVIGLSFSLLYSIIVILITSFTTETTSKTIELYLIIVLGYLCIKLNCIIICCNHATGKTNLNLLTK